MGKQSGSFDAETFIRKLDAIYTVNRHEYGRSEKYKDDILQGLEHVDPKFKKYREDLRSERESRKESYKNAIADTMKYLEIHSPVADMYVSVFVADENNTCNYETRYKVIIEIPAFKGRQDVFQRTEELVHFLTYGRRYRIDKRKGKEDRSLWYFETFYSSLTPLLEGLNIHLYSKRISIYNDTYDKNGNLEDNDSVFEMEHIGKGRFRAINKKIVRVYNEYDELVGKTIEEPSFPKDNYIKFMKELKKYMKSTGLRVNVKEEDAK
ncbi:MAG TPA: hypothetical protein VJH34_03595 [archaeon]|nr:hypothetical protein [archaeon]